MSLLTKLQRKIYFSTFSPIFYNISTRLFVLETYYSFVPSLDAGSSPESSSAVPSAMLDLGASCHQRVSPTYRERLVVINNGGWTGRHSSWRNNDFKQENIKTKPQKTTSTWKYDVNLWIFPESSKSMDEIRTIRQYKELQLYNPS